jgi:hypothetical protein
VAPWLLFSEQPKKRGTELITMREGKICRLSPEEIAKLPPIVESTPASQRTTGL